MPELISDEKRQQAVSAAIKIMDMAYAPYSRFQVGAAIIDEQGRLHQGVNVENAAYPNGSCAETGAIAAMIAAGGKQIQYIAVAGRGAFMHAMRCLSSADTRICPSPYSDCDLRPVRHQSRI